MLTWLEHRIGIRKLVGMTLLEGVPGGAKWRYVWGSCLAFVFSIQLITGLLLMTAYSPSASQAWSSVHYIQYKMDFGWFIRGLHHFGSQTMMVLIGLHMLQVVIAGAHLPPREINWWTGMGLLGVTFGLSLTGYLLPWDQKGYWATEVATNIMGNIPYVGDLVKTQAVGGPDSGSHTLTRFYGLHVAILPGILILLVVAHIYVFRRHGVTSSANVEGLITKPENEHAAGSETFWPRQAFYDMIACMAIFAVMMGLVLYGFSHPVEAPDEAGGPKADQYNFWAKAGQRGLGADLDAPADRQTTNYEARPEWYFLFLFQLLKYFPADVGSFYIPNGLALLLAALPLLGYGPMRKFGHFVGMLVMMTLLILIVGLTALALRDDAPDGILFGLVKNPDEKAIAKAKHFRESVHQAEALARRACQAAMPGTPVEGAHVMMRNDPFTAGRKAFQENCGSCHNFSRRDGDLFEESWTGGKSASDLGDFGSERWIRGLLADPMQDKYFGLVKMPEEDDGKPVKDAKGNVIMVPALTGMRGWRKKIDDTRKKENWNAQQIAAQEEEFDAIAKWLAAQAKPKADRNAADNEFYLKGQDPFFKDSNRCSECHTIEKLEKDEKTGKLHYVLDGGESAPQLVGYGSADWVRSMIMRPGHKTRYADRNRMPAFRNTDGPGSDVRLKEFLETNPNTKENTILPLLDVEREMIIRWMLRDYRPVFGGSSIK